MIAAKSVASADIESVSKIPFPIFIKKGILKSGEKKRPIYAMLFELVSFEKMLNGLSPRWIKLHTIKAVMMKIVAMHFMQNCCCCFNCNNKLMSVAF